MTIQEAQQLRKEGYNVITNRNFTKVLRASKDTLTQGKNERLWGAMIVWKASAQDQEDAWNKHILINKSK